LARQTDDPEGLFAARLRGGAETRITLDQSVPVHIDYRTAFTNIDGSLQFRRDVYGRDAAIWDALASEGVAVRAVQG
jgi:murein L,D-transpeptidase YcbB/YkuD